MSVMLVFMLVLFCHLMSSHLYEKVNVSKRLANYYCNAANSQCSVFMVWPSNLSHYTALVKLAPCITSSQYLLSHYGNFI